MRKGVGWRLLGGLCVLTAVLAFGVPSALAAFHGIGVGKSCTSPVKIGAPYTCAVQILNVVDTGQDTLRLTGLSDTVNASGGPVATTNILPSTGLVFSGPVTCTGGTGTGTAADPYIGATECLLPFGSSIVTKPFSHYTVQASDFTLPDNKLTDTATVNWNNTCISDPDQDCSTAQQQNTAGASALVQKLVSVTATDIHNAQDLVVTTAAAGAIVHDFVTVTGQPSSPKPSGAVTIDWFTNGTCTTPATTTSGKETLDANGQVDATDFPQGPLAAGFYSFRAHYAGDATYLASDGACEPLQIVDANISITPNGVNRVGQTHTFTAHVNVNTGSGFVPAPDGTQINFTIDGGPGAFTSANPCTT